MIQSGKTHDEILKFLQLSQKDWEYLTENCQKISNTSDLELEVILTGNQGSGPIGGTEILDKDKKLVAYL